MVLISVFLAFVYALIAAILVKIITNFFMTRKKTYELGFCLSAVALGLLSVGLLFINLPFASLNYFLKAGITFSVIQLLAVPVLIVLKRTSPQTYIKFINWFEK